MLQNYFKVTIRNLVRNKVYSTINIAGLAIGISSCILIFLYIQHELSYDKSFKNSDRIYRVVSEIHSNGQEMKWAISPGPLGPVMATEYPEVEQMTRLIGGGKQAVRFGNKVFYIDNVYTVDSTFFSVFDYPFVAGNPETALQEPNSVVVTEEVAQKFFGGAMSALNKLLKISNKSYKVTGVIALQGASHLKPDILIPLASRGKSYLQNLDTGWGQYVGYTYLLLHDSEQAASLQEKLSDFFERKIKENPSDPLNVIFHLQKLPNIYFQNEWQMQVSETGSLSYLYIFAAVAIFILFIASINYINLATARSAKRAKEVGMRKAIGAYRSQIIFQFLSESLFLSLLATILALVIVELTLPAFNVITEKNIASEYLLNPELILAILALILFIGVVAGSYPAFFLSHYKPTEVLKSNNTPRGGNSMLRKSLVVLQFTISLVLIIGTVVIYSQMLFLRNANLGFNQEQVLALDIPISNQNYHEKLAQLKNELLKSPQVVQTSTVQNLPGQQTSMSDFDLEIDHKTETKNLNVINVGYHYLNLMDIKLVAGRNFSEDMPTDKDHAYIINEAAAKEFGWVEPIGKEIRFNAKDSTSGKVIGVIKDYNYKSLHTKVEPLVLYLWPNNGYLLARINTSVNLSSTLKDIEQVWQKYYPDYPMEHHFLDESFQQQYRAEEKMLTIFGYFAGLTILIACLGLFGLASFTAEQRNKEIGIRKVLGSSVSGIVILLSKNFALLVLIAIMLAIPIAWYGMNKWLQDFAYRVELSWWIFALAGLVAMAIALLTVSYQALKAAVADPVKALRTE